MDFSLFRPLLELRAELAKATEPGAVHDKAAIALLNRVAQLRERALPLLAKQQPATDIEDVFRAAAAPLPALLDDTAAKAARPKRAAKPDKTAGTKKTATATKATKAPRARKQKLGK